MTTLSIRRRLLFWLLSALLLAGVLAGFATYFKAQGEVSELFDYELKQIALSILNEQPITGLPLGTTRGKADEDSDFISQIWGKNGALIYSSQPELALPIRGSPGFTTLYFDNELWRVFILKNGHRTVQVGQRLSEQEELVAAMALRLLTPQLTLLPLLAVLIWIAVGRGLLPLRRIATEMSRRSPSAMEPLPSAALPMEIKPLVEALNDLLQRLSGALDTQRRFIEDAAHELRTPLTAVKLQAQILERAGNADESTTAMQRLKQGVERATHLTQQLLTLARIEPEAAQRPLTRLNLEELVRTVLVHYAPLAQERNVDLGLTYSEPAEISGDEESLRIMLENLIDNAIRYTPEGGTVDVSLCVHGKDIVLDIVDTGGGIPAEERTRVFNRFYRCSGTGIPGSGLGLAIVKHIADRHQGKIVLDQGPNQVGLKVSAIFKSASV